MSIEALREIVSRLNTSAGALAALGAALDARLTGHPLSPAIEPHIREIIDGLGASQTLDGVSPAELAPVLGEIKTFALLNAKLVSRATEGWTHTEPELLQSTGAISAAFPHVLKARIVPALEGLSARLESTDASFLDVGVGVGALSIEMARLWPSLSVVGIDPWAPSLALARDNVRKADLATRIELREQAAEALDDTDHFDLGWLPSSFMPESVIPAAIERVHRALRPGGWLLFAIVRPGADPIAGPLASLRTAMFGGMVGTPAEAEDMLRHAGFVDVRTLPSPPTAPAAMIAARRDSDSTLSQRSSTESRPRWTPTSVETFRMASRAPSAYGRALFPES